MGIGASVFLVALGAVLTFALDLKVSGVDLSTVGVILMVAGVVGLLVSLVVSNNMSGRRGDRVVTEGRRADRIVTEERVVRDDRL